MGKDKPKPLSHRMLDKEVTLYMSEHKGANYTFALKEVTKKTPELWTNYLRDI